MATSTAALLVAIVMVVSRAGGAQAAVSSVVTDWLTIAQTSVFSVQIEHQQAARVYAIVSSGKK